MTETNWRELCRKLVQHAATAQLVLVGDGLWEGDEDDGLLERARAAIEADELAVIESRIGADVVTSRIESNDGRLVTVSEVARLPLSPAARAVLDAMRRSYDHEPTRRLIAADILRAAADQVVPEEPLYGGDQRWMYERDARQTSRRKLLAIAAELKGADG